MLAHSSLMQERAAHEARAAEVDAIMAAGEVRYSWGYGKAARLPWFNALCVWLKACGVSIYRNGDATEAVFCRRVVGRYDRWAVAFDNGGELTGHLLHVDALAGGHFDIPTVCWSVGQTVETTASALLAILDGEPSPYLAT